VQQHDYSEIEQSLAAFVRPGDVFEVRLLHASRKRVDAGYFTHPSHAATAIAGLHDAYAGIYFTPNPVAPDLAARAFNRIKEWSSLTTHDGDITERRWLLVDVDSTRPSGISATDDELNNAFKVARRIANMLELEGWPRPNINASGNGVHLMYAFNEPNNEYVRDAVALFLKCLDARFKGDGCTVDTVNFNAARIWRIPGTWARKGDNVPTRPHRKAHILEVPTAAIPVPLAKVLAFNTANQHLVTAPTNLKSDKPKNEYPLDERKYKGLNEQAMARLAEWVPVYYPTAREYKKGYRVSSDDLGLSHEEDLTIHPWPLGIKYFGVSDQGDATEGRRTPISLLAELNFLGDKGLAARKLADTLNAPLTEFDNIEPAQVPAGLSLPGTGAPARLYDFKRVPSLADLQKRTFKEQTWVIKDILPTGNIMLAARPKMRKTFLALQLGLAIVGGGKFLNWTCEQGDVLFLGLEDNERRLRSRIKLLQTLELNPPDLSGFRYWTGGVDISPTTGKQYVSNPEEAERTYNTFPRGEAGVEALNKFLDEYPKTKLIVIDTLAHFRDQSNNRDIYQRDYDQMMPLTRLAADRQVLVMPVHHEKKGLASQDSGDFMEDVSGSSGITGAVDGVISIKGKRGVQEENECRKLLLSGRDVPRDIDVDMSFDAERGGWQTAARQDVQVMLKELLVRHPFINQQEFSSLLPNVSKARISQVLTQLKYDGSVVQSKYGYSLARDHKEL
jgi:AAA domain